MIAPAAEGGEILFTGGVGRSHRSENPTLGRNLWAADAGRQKLEAGEEGEVSESAVRQELVIEMRRMVRQASTAAGVRHLIYVPFALFRYVHQRAREADLRNFM